MTMTTTCTNCGKLLKTTKQLAEGALLKCPQCQEQFRFQAPAKGLPELKASSAVAPPPARSPALPPPLPRQAPPSAAPAGTNRASGGWTGFIFFVGLVSTAVAGGAWYFGRDYLRDLKIPFVRAGNRGSVEPDRARDAARLDAKQAEDDADVADRARAAAEGKPFDAREFAAGLTPPGDVSEELWPEDEFFPRRKMIIPRVKVEPHGAVRHYGPQRRLMCVDRYVNGLLQERRTFFPSGKPFSLLRYVKGKAHGVLTNWFENGNLAYTGTWVNGVQTGPAVTYFNNGKVGSESILVAGVAQGERRHHLPDGRLFGISQFQDGVEVGQKVLIEPTQLDFFNIEQRAKYSTILKDHWTPAHIAMERDKENSSPDPDKKVGEWVSLFNGRNLDGWWPTTRSADNVKWEVRDGAIVGSGNGHMGYLYRDEDDFGDFRLRAEVRINSAGNSGLMLRGKSEKAFDTGWPQGIEVQIAIADKQLKTGGLYMQGVSWTSNLPLTGEEARPPPTGADVKRGKRPGRAVRQESARTAIGNTNQLHHAAGEWFTIEVEIQGKNASGSVNGTKTAEGHFEAGADVLPTKGFIGLQVHPRGPTTVEFRKIEVMHLEPGL